MQKKGVFANELQFLKLPYAEMAFFANESRILHIGSGEDYVKRNASRTGLTKCHYIKRRKCQRMTPTLTETFRECLVPNCGISRQKSAASTTS